MKYVIQRTDGAFVAPPGSPHSYTQSIFKARKFDTRQAAESEVCPANERVRSTEELGL